jgi:hypothetical protein
MSNATRVTPRVTPRVTSKSCRGHRACAAEMCIRVPHALFADCRCSFVAAILACMPCMNMRVRTAPSWTARVCGARRGVQVLQQRYCVSGIQHSRYSAQLSSSRRVKRMRVHRGYRDTPSPAAAPVRHAADASMRVAAALSTPNRPLTVRLL